MKGFPQLHGFKSHPGFVRLIGHRGARGLMPENTIEGFEYTLDLGVMALEFDVLLSKDNVPVITHDNYLSGAVTRDNKVLIIPKHMFLTKILYNWTENGTLIRESVSVGVAYNSNVEFIEKSLIKLAFKAPLN